METINKDTLKKIFESILYSMSDAKEELIALDGSMGDGDLGLTMCNGFKVICDEFDNITDDDLGTLLIKLGMKMNSAVPSTMGTLIATCILKAGSKVKGKTFLDLNDLSTMAQAAADGVMQRGNSKVGDKTMLDALYPAANALKNAAVENKDMFSAQQDAYKATCLGVENTKNLKSVHGRAAYYSEKSIGRRDPGAVAVMYIFRGIAAVFNK
ncbi:dihydroxyacetone kinase subunit DhaL [Pectinatus frisingensis]|uniref:dihydroxyacetone kinase subunit DhaL n=1 Tax=Pectinatus frisingensis TaxID=865 RepID=UPI0015F6499E|nr:dihydroxyacetone kinase subunit DhaL [Pectinatus frisingensis]